MKSLLAVACAIICAFPVRAAEKPNIVLLLADDLGYGDLGCTGHPYAKTPALDKLAGDGTLFHNFYVSGATCCPSRTGLMTGRCPATFQKYPADFGFGGAPTVTEVLKAAGYKTGHFGKWHIGAEQKNGTFGIDAIKVLGGNRRDATGRDSDIAAAAIDFIKANKDGPFYLNVWFHTAHNPVNPPKGFADKFANLAVNRGDFKNPDQLAHFDLYKKLGGNVDEGMRNYLGDVLQLDGQVAKVLKALDDLGLRKNTLVVFTSDNGPANCTGGDDGAAAKNDKLKDNMLGSAGPFRERKHSLYDGGVHQSLIVRWPGRVKEGRVDRASVLAGVDWLPTLAGLTGAKVPSGDKLDGEDVSAAWFGKEHMRKTDLYWKASAPNSTPAMRRGNWKFHEGRRVPAELYDLSKDPGERENVAAKFPAVARELSAALKKWNDALPKTYEKGDAKD